MCFYHEGYIGRKRLGTSSNRGTNGPHALISDVFVVRAGDHNAYVALSTKKVSFPNSWLGKKVRFKIEIIEENE